MKPAARDYDAVVCDSHSGPLGEVEPLGKANVFINGRAAARLGDTATCNLPAAALGHLSLHPSRVISGSPDVNIGGPVFALPRNVRLGGDQDYRNKTIRDLWLLSQTPTGREIFDRLQRAGGEVSIEPGEKNFMTPDGHTIFYNPDLKMVAEDEDRRPISAPPQTALGHELVHAVRAAEGTISKDWLDEERRARGDKSHVEDDTINENRLRDDLGLPRRDGPELHSPEIQTGPIDGPLDLRPGGY